GIPARADWEPGVRPPGWNPWPRVRELEAGIRGRPTQRGPLMDDRSGQAGRPLWADGDMLLRVRGLERGARHIGKGKRTYAMIGRGAGADICIPDPAVSAQHLYWHLDGRGLFAVDLMTRSGTRLNGADWTSGWLRPGDELEVAGRRLEVLRLRVGGAVQ